MALRWRESDKVIGFSNIYLIYKTEMHFRIDLGKGLKIYERYNHYDGIGTLS